MADLIPPEDLKIEGDRHPPGVTITHIPTGMRGTIFDKPETWDDAVDPKPFATSGAEAQFNEHQAHACPSCGGSGHAGDVATLDAKVADLDRWHQDMRAAVSGFCSMCDNTGMWQWTVDDADLNAGLIADAMAIERRKREGTST